jgi:hypothetical protein
VTEAFDNTALEGACFGQWRSQGAIELRNGGALIEKCLPSVSGRVEPAGVFVIAYAIDVGESISSLDILHVAQVGRRVAPW